MKQLLNKDEISNFKRDGAALIKEGFTKEWIEKLRKGIDEDIKNPSPRFV